MTSSPSRIWKTIVLDLRLLILISHVWLPSMRAGTKTRSPDDNGKGGKFHWEREIKGPRRRGCWRPAELWFKQTLQIKLSTVPAVSVSMWFDISWIFEKWLKLGIFFDDFWEKVFLKDFLKIISFFIDSHSWFGYHNQHFQCYHKLKWLHQSIDQLDNRCSPMYLCLYMIQIYWYYAFDMFSG